MSHKQLAALHTRLKNSERAVSRLRTEFETLREDVEFATGSDVAERLAALESAVATLESSVASLESDMTQAQSDITQAQSDITQLANQMVTLDMYLDSEIVEHDSGGGLRPWLRLGNSVSPILFIPGYEALP